MAEQEREAARARDRNRRENLEGEAVEQVREVARMRMRNMRLHL